MIDIEQTLHRCHVRDLINAVDFVSVEHTLAQLHQDAWANPYYSIDDLPFTQTQKEIALEWLAWQLEKLRKKIYGEWHSSKTYDPLFIQDRTAHSYAFDLWDGGRHHEFKSFEQLQDGMLDEFSTELVKEK